MIDPMSDFAGPDGGGPRLGPGIGLPPPGSKTLNAGLRLLWLLRGNPDGMTVAEMSRISELDRNAVSRMLGALAHQRLVTRSEAGRYCLGLGLVELSLGVRQRLRETTVDELRLLAENCRATAFITALDGENEAVVVSVIEPRESMVHVAYRVGRRHPADRGASGVALLAGRPPRANERPAIAQARIRGYAVTSSELQPGAWGLAAPIKPDGQIAESSVGVVAIGELDEAQTAPYVLAAAASIGNLMRHSGS